MAPTAQEIEPARSDPWAVFAAFLRLGLTSFGGPVAHIGYFREAFVVRRRWLDDAAYADLVALCQLLPGPASSQVGLGIGLYRAGYLGAIAAWCGFTLPSAALMIAFGYGVAVWGQDLHAGVLRGLKIAAVAVVAHAVLGMGRTLCPDRKRATLAAAAAALVLILPVAIGPPNGLLTAQLAAIAGGALFGRLALEDRAASASRPLAHAVSRRVALAALALFAALLLLLPVLAAATGSALLAVIDAIYRAGALVFGGGHVVLPLLHGGVTEPGWVDPQSFLAGYGAAQALPGPLFTFAAYLGVVIDAGPGWPAGWLGGVIALAAIFAGSALVVIGALPFWDRLRGAAGVRGAMAGVNAAVVGLLIAALYDPVITAGIRGPEDVALGLLGFVALAQWRAPAWALVAVLAVVGLVAL